MAIRKAFILLNILALCFLSLSHNRLLAITKKLVKKPNVAGVWYPADKKALSAALKQLMVRADNDYGMEVQGKLIRACVVPHAGYSFSGVVAASAFSLIKYESFDRIIILGPSHFASFYGVAMPLFNRYQIPLGSLAIDGSSLVELQASSLFNYQKFAFNREHSLEAVLPFISLLFPKTPVVPLLIGQLATHDITIVAEQLKTIITPSTLVVVSSDITHYGLSFNYTPFAGKKNIVGLVQELDSQLLQYIQHQDLKGFRQAVKEKRATICGEKCIDILLELIALNAFGSCIVRCAAYATSESKMKKNIENPLSLVTYASLIVTQETSNLAVNAFEKQSLLRYARSTLEKSFAFAIQDREAIKPILTLPLEALRGVFVTLYVRKDGTKQLRGCIGNIESAVPLYQNVADMARAAAFNDSRFSPLQAHELTGVEIEISILQPPHAVASYRDIILNKHGIILSQGNASALFLPKVPQEFGFDLPQTLAALSRKAGLPGNAWKSSYTTFQVFETLDFSEHSAAESVV